MLRHVRPYLAALLLSTISGCAAKEPIAVRVEQGALTTAAHYRTYAWRSPAADDHLHSPGMATRRDWHIRAFVDRWLAGRGFERAPASPDFLVDYELTETEKQISSFGEYLDYYRAGGAKGPIDTFTLGYSEGALVLGIFEASTQHLIWRASATAFADQGDSEPRLEEVLQRMLDRLPLRPPTDG